VKLIRYISVILLFILSGWNICLGIIHRPEPDFFMYFVFGAGFFALGAVLNSRFRSASSVGFIVSATVLIVYPMIADLRNFTPWSSGIMAGVVAIVVICCLILMMLKVKN
jgi:hypothetical protein